MSDEFIWRFTPSRTDPALLENIFVQREKILKDVVGRVVESVTTGNKHNILLIGPRGIGKTHFVSLVRHRLSQNKKLKNRLRVAWLNEDHTSISFAHLLSRIYRDLSNEYPKEFPIQKLDELLHQKSVDEIERQLKKILVDEFSKKTMLVIIENLDLLLEGLGPEGQKKWRAFLQEHPITCLLATTQRLVKSINKRDKPFHGFFAPIRLEPLSMDDAIILLSRIATYNNQIELVNYLQTLEGRSRVRALHHLAGGNHRIYIVLSGFVSRDSLEGLVHPFEKMADELTPYYQERMRWLSPQQRQIIEFLCTRTSPVTPKEIARNLLASANTIGSQIKKLSDLGYVLSQRRGKESLYELSEPLMRLASEVKQRGTLRLLVDFLRIWYRPEKLPEMLQSARSHSLKAHISAAILRCKDTDDPRLSAIQYDIDDAKAQGNSKEEIIALEEKAHTTNNAKDWIEYATVLDKNNRYEEAIKCYNKALKIEPEDLYAWNGKGNSLNDLNRYEEAIECYNKVLEIEPEDQYSWSNKGSSLNNLKRYEEAIECYNKALKIEPEDQYSWNGKGNSKYYLNRYEEAIEYYNKALEIEPEYKFAWTNKGLSLNHLKRYEEAIECYNKALEIEPEYKYAWNGNGNSLNELKRYEEAIECYNKTLEIEPEDVYAWNGKGNSKYYLNRYEEAIECYNKALEIEPEYKFSWNGKGNSLNDLNRYEEAIECYNKVLEIEPEDQDALYNKGDSLNNLKRYEEAIECYNKALEIEPEDQDALNNKGNSLNNLKRYEEAIECYNKALEIEPEYKFACNGKGISLNNLKRYEEAIECYNKALEIEPENQYVWSNKGDSLNNLERYEKAIECYNKALEIEPEDQVTWNDKGNSLNHLNRYEEAIECYNKALEIEPEDQDTWNDKGISLNDLKRYEEAIECYSEALEINPKNSLLRFNSSESFFQLGKWADGFKSLKNAFQVLTEEYFADTESIVYLLNRKSDGTEALHEHVKKLVGIYENAGFLTELGGGLVRSLAETSSEKIAPETLKDWSNVWSDVSVGREDLEISIRIYKVGIKYIISQDEKVFLDLVSTERTILKQALGIEEVTDL